MKSTAKLAALLLLVSAACQQDPQIQAGERGMKSSARKGNDAAQRPGGGSSRSSDRETGDSGTLDESTSGSVSGTKPSDSSAGSGSNIDPTFGNGLSSDASAAPVAVDYPRLTLNGKGTTSCKQDLETTTQVETQASGTELRVARVDVQVACYRSGFLGIGACDQDEFNQEVRNESLGETVFARATAEEAKAAKAAGVQVEPFVLLATRATTHKGQVYVFDKPIPVFPWPAASAKQFEKLDAGAITYTANYSGPVSGTISVKVEKVGGGGDAVTVKFTTTLNGGTKHEDFDKFPMPHQATYDIDTKSKDVRRMQSTDLFSDDQCPEEGQVTMDYRLCRKATKDKTEDFPCM